MDWKVWAAIDRKALIADIEAMLGILKRQRVYCIVTAFDREEAESQAVDHLDKLGKISPRYIRSLNARRMRT